MYPIILALHSAVRWLVLLSLIIALFRGYRGWRAKLNFGNLDNSIRYWTVTIAHIQLVLGLTLYFISPITNYFIGHFSDAVHQREIRFFGMEHSIVMLAAIVCITIGSAKAKRKKTSHEKFRIIVIWISIALVLILSSIPWAFSPLTSRPHFRPFP